MYTLLIKKSFLFTILACSFLITGCSLERKLTGSWKIAEYSEITVNGSSSNAVNAGTIEFNSNGTGVNDLDYRIFGNTLKEERSFTYNVGDNYVTIKPVQDADSIAAKSWIVMESRRSKQLWKSTDGEGNVQTLVLEKAN